MDQYRIFLLISLIILKISQQYKIVMWNSSLIQFKYFKIIMLYQWIDLKDLKRLHQFIYYSLLVNCFYTCLIISYLSQSNFNHLEHFVAYFANSIFAPMIEQSFKYLRFFDRNWPFLKPKIWTFFVWQNVYVRFSFQRYSNHFHLFIFYFLFDDRFLNNNYV